MNIKQKTEQLEKLKEKTFLTLNSPLKKTAKNLVFGKGNPDAEIMFVGEAPGAQEDIKGIPFVGKAGQELDRLLQVIGLNLEKVYIANILKYRPPGNRDPTPEEIEQHTPYLIEQIKIIRPKIIITLGNYSTKFFLAHFKVNYMRNIPGISVLHGKAKDVKINGIKFKVIAMYHPAATLYKPPLRKVLEQDFINIKEILKQKSKQKSLDSF